MGVEGYEAVVRTLFIVGQQAEAFRRVARSEEDLVAPEVFHVGDGHFRVFEEQPGIEANAQYPPDPDREFMVVGKLQQVVVRRRVEGTGEGALVVQAQGR